MKLPLLIFALFSLSLHATSLNVAAVGGELNGWQGGVARYSQSGASFELGKPSQTYDENNNLIIKAKIREVKRGAPVFEGAIRLLVSPDGLVRTASFTGAVDGHEISTGEVTRPEPPEAPPAAEGEETTASAVPEPVSVSPSQQMQDDLKSRIISAIERAGESEKVVKRDLSSWLLSSSASDADVIASGTSMAVRSLFRHTS